MIATRTITARAALAWALAAPLAAAHADVLIDNLGEPVRNQAPLRSDFWYAQSFLTPAGGELALDALTVRVGGAFGAPSVVAQLRADNAGSPGAVLGLYTLPTLGTGATQDETLVPSGAGITLAATSTYWLMIGVAGSGGFDWSYAQGNGANGSGSFFEYTYSTDQALSWIGFGTEDPMMMRVDVSPVPEPAVLALWAAGLLMGCLRARATRPMQAA